MKTKKLNRLFGAGMTSLMLLGSLTMGAMALEGESYSSSKAEAQAKEVKLKHTVAMEHSSKRAKAPSMREIRWCNEALDTCVPETPKVYFFTVEVATSVNENADTYGSKSPEVSFSERGVLVVGNITQTPSEVKEVQYRLLYAGEDCSETWLTMESTCLTNLDLEGLETIEVRQVNNAGISSEVCVYNLVDASVEENK